MIIISRFIAPPQVPLPTRISSSSHAGHDIDSRQVRQVGFGTEGDRLPASSLHLHRSGHKHISHPHYIEGILSITGKSGEVDPKRKDDQSLASSLRAHP